MANENDIREMIRAIRKIEFSKHFSADVLPERYISKENVENAIKNGELLSVEEQSEGRYKLVFIVTNFLLAQQF